MTVDFIPLKLYVVKVIINRLNGGKEVRHASYPVSATVRRRLPPLLYPGPLCGPLSPYSNARRLFRPKTLTVVWKAALFLDRVVFYNSRMSLQFKF